MTFTPDERRHCPPKLTVEDMDPLIIRGRKFMKLYEAMTPHARRLLFDEIRYDLAQRGFSPRAILTVPWAAIQALRLLVEEDMPCLDE